jgi:hypothetical protein
MGLDLLHAVLLGLGALALAGGFAALGAAIVAARHAADHVTQRALAESRGRRLALRGRAAGTGASRPRSGG